MSSNVWPRGLVTALVTPMRDDHVDFDKIGELVEFQIEAGASGIVVGGGTGEFGALSYQERADIAHAAVDFAAGRIPVIAQTGCLSSKDAFRLTDDANRSGAAGVMVASPFGEPINWRERFAFYRQLSTQCSLPIMLYNTTAAGLFSVDEVVELSTLANVTAIKDSSGNAEFMGDVLDWAVSKDFTVYAGRDSFVYESLALGAHGAVMGLASFLPQPFVHIINSIRTERPTVETREYWRSFRRFLRFVENSSNYIALCKLGCRITGYDVGDVRAPYLMPSREEADEFAAQLLTYLTIAKGSDAYNMLRKDSKGVQECDRHGRQTTSETHLTVSPLAEV